MEVLGTHLQLERALKDMEGSPIGATVEAVEHASLDILSMHTKQNEVHIEDLTQRLAAAKAKNLVARAQSYHEAAPLNERSVVTLRGVSREVQPNQTAVVRIIRDTFYADPSGI